MTNGFAPTEMPTAIDGVAIAVFDGEAVLFDETSSMLHRLGAIAGGVWLYCDGGTAVASMIDELADAFDLDVAEVTPIVHETLERFADEGLLVGHDGPVRLPVANDSPVADDGTEILITPPDP